MSPLTNSVALKRSLSDGQERFPSQAAKYGLGD